MSELEVKENQKIDLVETRSVLCHRENLKVLEVFDTIVKTSGAKDVSLCQTENESKVILRIGEIRPSVFFLDGFEGRYFVVPKIFERQENETPYEIEEYLEGILVGELDKQQAITGEIDTEISKRLIAAFWEFQQVARDIGLEQKFDISMILKHFDQAKPLLKEPELIQRLINQYKTFWEGAFPSKWKFATDNLIVVPDGRIGFIDNAGVGLRYFGYDLGWLLWPRWVEMETGRFNEVDDHFKYLGQFMEQVRDIAPQKVGVIEDFDRKFWLVIFERLVGAIYDVARNVRHLDDWGMGKNGDEERKEKHLAFLNELLARVVRKV